MKKPHVLLAILLVAGATKVSAQQDDGNERVRASWQATPILEAIGIVADGLDDVVVGATTRLKFCSHFVDRLGHISNGEFISGAADVAVTTGLFYRDFSRCSRAVELAREYREKYVMQ